MTTLYADRHATPKPRDTPANWRVDWDLFTALRAARTPSTSTPPPSTTSASPTATPPSASPNGSPTASTTSDLQATRH